MKFLITPWFINHQLALAMGVCHVPLQGLKWKLLSPVWLFVTPGTIQSMEFSRPEYWSWKPFPSPGIFPTQGLNPGLPHCRKILYQLSYQGSPIIMIKSCWSYWPLIPHKEREDVEQKWWGTFCSRKTGKTCPQIAQWTQWTWVWACSGRWWRTGKPGMLISMESQKVRQKWMTEQQ